MPSDPQEKGTLKPITLARLTREITTLSAQRKSGEINSLTYDQRFARMIGELRERRIEGSRADILAALTPLKEQGTITAGEFDRVTKQLGLAGK